MPLRLVLFLGILFPLTPPLLAADGDGHAEDGTLRVQKAASDFPSTSQNQEEALDVARPEEAIQGEPSSNSNEAAVNKNLGINPITGTGSVSGISYSPLTNQQRWQLYLNQNFRTTGAYLGMFASSIIDHVQDSPPEWGDGAAGYGKRLASRFGTNVIQGTVQAAGCAALGFDPRYVRSKSTGALSRTGHALLYTFVTLNNEGKPRPSVATLGSYYASGMMSVLWLPQRYTALGDGIRDGNRLVIYGGLFNVVQEFWPEVKKLFRRQ
jgi:hypothetical protein